MTHVHSHAPGSFCWIEMAARDSAAAIDFYAQLFSWTVAESAMADAQTYFIFQKNGRDAAGMYAITERQPALQPHWMSYIAVSSADDSFAKAQTLGARTLMEPFDVFDRGRMAVLADPSGAPFSIWEARGNAGVGVRDEADALCWNELQTHDVAGSKKFYPPLFNWRMKESDEYTEWHLGEHAVGGMMQAQGPPDAPPFWMPYFAVDDCDAKVALAQSIGANVYVPPMDIPNIGRFAVMADPQGAVFAVIKLLM
ncbi:MAG TPA: VOC family protein [Thermoanaerobaculia bacterium]|nr:VOC family protein [Thermoanaerobaculia bacterium]